MHSNQDILSQRWGSVAAFVKMLIAAAARSHWDALSLSHVLKYVSQMEISAVTSFAVHY